MGCCFSSGNQFKPSCPATSPPRVLTLDGSLLEYSRPVTVSQVLGAADQQSSFLCSESLIFPGQMIPAMDSEDLLEPDNTYFQLPGRSPHRPLSEVEMVDLAVKASSLLPVCSDIAVEGQPCKKERLSTVQEVTEPYISY